MSLYYMHKNSQIDLKIGTAEIWYGDNENEDLEAAMCGSL